MNAPDQCFLSYAHHDYKGFVRLRVHMTHLARLYSFKLWHDERIHAGTHWGERIQKEISGSQIFILLATNDFFASDYIFFHELPAIIERHRNNNALVLPLIYRECGWKAFFQSYIQVVPLEKGRLRPVCDWPDREKALAVAAETIEEAIKDWFKIAPRSLFDRGPAT